MIIKLEKIIDQLRCLKNISFKISYSEKLSTFKRRNPSLRVKLRCFSSISFTKRLSRVPADKKIITRNNDQKSFRISLSKCLLLLLPYNSFLTQEINKQKTHFISAPPKFAPPQRFYQVYTFLAILFMILLKIPNFFFYV